MERTLKLFALIVIIIGAVPAKLLTSLPANFIPATLSSRQFEEIMLGQLFAIAEQRCGFKFDAKTLEEKKAVLENMPLETKERILEELAKMVLDEGEHPFLAPPGTNFSQFDMFFLLSITLMSHNKELCDGLTRCINEKALFKLKAHLDKVLGLVSPHIRAKLTPTGPKEQFDFIRKIKARIGTPAKPSNVNFSHIQHRILEPSNIGAKVVVAS